MDLMRKGVSKDLIEQALSQEYQSDERKMIEQILQKKDIFPVRSCLRNNGECMGICFGGDIRAVTFYM